MTFDEVFDGYWLELFQSDNWKQAIDKKDLPGMVEAIASVFDNHDMEYDGYQIAELLRSLLK